jgi:hypothetical protein
MPKTHPHAEAIYEVVLLDAGKFGVKVSIPDTNPTTVSSFDSEAAAEAWIIAHKARIQAYGRRIGVALMRRPNYRFERAERDRMKQAKKEDKARRQQERASQRTSEEADQPSTDREQ